MLGITLLVIFSPIVLWLLYWYWRVKHFEKYLKNIPGPELVPLLGSIWEFRSPKSILAVTNKYYKKYNGNFKMYAGSRPMLMVYNLKDVEFLLKSTTMITKADQYRFLRNCVGDGLLLSTGDKWRKHRQIITGAFHFQVLESFMDVFNRKADILTTILHEASKKGSFNIYPFIARCALDVICESAMGKCVNAQTDLESPFVKNVDLLGATAMKRNFSLIYSNDFLYRFTELYRKERDALKFCHNYAQSVLNERKEEILKNRKDRAENAGFVGKKKNLAFLDLLLEYSLEDPSFTQQDISDEVDTLMITGYDSVTTMTTFTLLALANNSDIQEKTCIELKAIFEDDPTRSITYNDLHKMRYLEMVIKETMRMYAIPPFLGRMLEEDTDFNGTLLPKGMDVLICNYGIQNSELVHKNPQKFDPERFKVDNSVEKEQFSYTPFSAGPRNCIGQKFAMMEMKVLITNILRNFEILPTVPPHKLSIVANIILFSENGVFVQLKPRA